MVMAVAMMMLVLVFTAETGVFASYNVHSRKFDFFAPLLASVFTSVAIMTAAAAVVAVAAA